jgi:hypothetical protein
MTRRCRVESQETGDIIVQHDPLTDTRSSTGSAPKSGAWGGDECQRERYGYRPTRPPDTIGVSRDVGKVSVSGGSLVVTIPYCRRADVSLSFAVACCADTDEDYSDGSATTDGA